VHAINLHIFISKDSNDLLYFRQQQILSAIGRIGLVLLTHSQQRTNKAGGGPSHSLDCQTNVFRPVVQ
jgi:hypothetical protein